MESDLEGQHETPANPYDAPLAPLKGGEEPPPIPPGPGALRRVAWTAVFAANLVMPLFFAWEITREHGRAGMAAAIGVFWLLGLYGWGKRLALSGTLLVGGAFVALSQVCPLLQIFAGLASLSVVAALGLMSSADERYLRTETELGGFLATILNGGLLLVPAWFVGELVCRIFGLMGREKWRWARRPGASGVDQHVDAAS